jgi:hypothetical protein
MTKGELTRLEQDIALIEQTIHTVIESGLIVVHTDDSAFENAQQTK